MSEQSSPAPVDITPDIPAEVPMREISSLGVVGAGTRGTELARLAASGDIGYSSPIPTHRP